MARKSEKGVALILTMILILVLSVMAVLGPGLLNVVLSLSLIITATNSRVIRGTTIGVAQNAFVEAARAHKERHLAGVGFAGFPDKLELCR